MPEEIEKLDKAVEELRKLCRKNKWSMLVIVQRNEEDGTHVDFARLLTNKADPSLTLISEVAKEVLGDDREDPSTAFMAASLTAAAISVFTGK
jgi:hypothetical protein